MIDADLDTLATALYARIDDLLQEHPELAPWRPKVGIAPKLSDTELMTLAVLQVLQGYAQETRWLRHRRLLAATVVSVSARPVRVQQTAAQIDRRLHDLGIELVRPAMKGERPRRGQPQLRSLRQITESITTPSKPYSAWITTVVTPNKASPPESCHASSH